MVDSQTSNYRLVRVQVVSDYSLDPVIAYEIAEPLHETVRVALDQYVQPQNLPVSASATTPTTFFTPFTRTAVSSAPMTFTCPPAPSGLFAARVSSRFLDVSPHAHARYRDAEGGEQAARGAQRQAERPRERSPSAHPLGLSAAVYSLRAMPEGSPAVGASVSDSRDFVLVEVYHGLSRPRRAG